MSDKILQEFSCTSHYVEGDLSAVSGAYIFLCCFSSREVTLLQSSDTFNVDSAVSSLSRSSTKY